MLPALQILLLHFYPLCLSFRLAATTSAMAALQFLVVWLRWSKQLRVRSTLLGNLFSMIWFLAFIFWFLVSLALRSARRCHEIRGRISGETRWCLSFCCQARAVGIYGRPSRQARWQLGNHPRFRYNLVPTVAGQAAAAAAAAAASRRRVQSSVSSLSAEKIKNLIPSVSRSHF